VIRQCQALLNRGRVHVDRVAQAKPRISAAQAGVAFCGRTPLKIPKVAPFAGRLKRRWTSNEAEHCAKNASDSRIVDNTASCRSAIQIPAANRYKIFRSRQTPNVLYHRQTSTGTVFVCRHECPTAETRTFTRYSTCRNATPTIPPPRIQRAGCAFPRHVGTAHFVSPAHSCR